MEVSAPAAPASTPAPVAGESSGWDGVIPLNIDGQQSTIDLKDPSVREKIIRRLQKEDVSDIRMRKAIEAAQKVADFEGTLKTDKLKALLKLGIDEKELRSDVESWLYEKIQEEQMPADKREAIQAKREKEALEERLRQIEEERNNQQQTVQVQQIRQQLEPMILKEVQDQGLPIQKYTYDRIIERLRQQEAYGMNINVKEAVSLAKEDISGMLGDVLSKADVNALIQFLGEDKLDAIRKHNVSKIQNNRVISAQPTTESPMPNKKPNQKMSINELRKLYRQRAGLS